MPDTALYESEETYRPPRRPLPSWIGMVAGLLSIIALVWLPFWVLEKIEIDYRSSEKRLSDAIAERYDVDTAGELDSESSLWQIAGRWLDCDSTRATEKDPVLVCKTTDYVDPAETPVP